jgi:site-specific recombinase XerD
MDRPMTHFGSWAAYMRRQGLSPGTIRMRRYELRSWDRAVGARWRKATWRDVETWIDARPLGARARQSAASHLRAFYRWARRDQLVSIDPCADVVTAKVPRRRPRPARDAIVRRAVDQGETRAQQACALMAYGGLRCCEVASLRWEDVDLVAGTMHVRGKGSHERVVPVASPLRPILARVDGLAGPVIPNLETGGPLHPQRVSTIVRTRLRAVGSDCTAHQLRHYAATTMGRHADGNLLVVRDFLGHASVATTEIYTQLIDGALAAAAARWR